MDEANTVSGAKIWVVLARAHGAMSTFVEQQVEGEDLCLGDFMVLEVLLHKGALTMSAIGEKVLLASASMTSAIDRLEKKALVVRKTRLDDRRVRLVELTREGKKIISEIYERHARELESLVTGLSAAERATLYRGLKKLGLAAEAASTENRKKLNIEKPGDRL
jgi:MarR family 2-MHQ and catechol resistance regulon transcriptional repressor